MTIRLEKKCPKIHLCNPFLLPTNASSPRLWRSFAAALAFFLGCFGAHKFYLGLNKAGIIYLVLGVVGMFVYPALIAVIVLSLFDVFKYLTSTPEEFEQVYVIGKKEWF